MLYFHQNHRGGVASRGFINTVVAFFAGAVTFVSSLFIPVTYSAPITYDFTPPVSLETIEYLPMPTVAGVSTTTVETVVSTTPPENDTPFITFALGALATTLRSEMASLATPSIPTPIWTAIAQSNRIDQLSGTSLTNIIVNGVSGLTDADIPNNITASNYLPLSGGSYTSANATTTNATSTTLFSTIARFTTATIDTLTATTLTATNATTTRLDALEYLKVGGTSTTTIRGDGTASTLPYASSTAITVSGTASTSALIASTAFTFKTVTGFLKATAGVVATALIDLASDVTGILPVANGGTGTSTAPTYGKVLLGNALGAYDLVATSSLGISSSAIPSGTTGQFPYYAAGGTTLTATSSIYLATTGNVGIGTTTPTYRLAVEGISSLGNQAIAGYFTATSTTASTFAGGVGVGSTTPWAELSVNPNGLTGPSFVVGSSSATNFIITNGGSVGVGTTSPFGRFAVQGAGSGTGTLFTLANSALTTVMNVLDNGVAYVLGNFGIGTSTPWRKFSVTDTVSSPQVAIAYDATRYAQLQVDSVGDLTLSAQGGDIYLTNENLFACTSGCPAGTPTGLGNILAENKLGVGTTTPVSKLTIETQDASTNFLQVASSTAQSIFGIFANGRIGIATSTPWKQLSVSGDGVLTGTLYLADGISNIAPTTCPSGMIPVPGSAADGQPGFCVDKYEVKGATTSPPVSSAAAGTPLVSITQYNARAACIVAGKHLITEKEWLAIAHNVENVGWNWNGGVAGTNQMSDGHSDNVPGNSLAADVTGNPDDDPCVGTGQACSLTTWSSQRRTYQLSNGEYIWDFGGNVWEWVDNVVSDDYPILNSGAAGWQACSASGDGICGNTRTTNDQWYRGGTTATRGFVRGGAWDYGAAYGAFTLALNNAPSYVNTAIGFRCAR